MMHTWSNQHTIPSPQHTFGTTHTQFPVNMTIRSDSCSLVHFDTHLEQLVCTQCALALCHTTIPHASNLVHDLISTLVSSAAVTYHGAPHMRPWPAMH